MKILTVVSDLKKGGTQRAAVNFAVGYKINGHDSRVYAVHELGSRYKDLVSEELIVYKGLPNLLSLNQMWMPDLIHIHSNGLNIEDVNSVLHLLKCEGTKVVETNVFSKPSVWEDSIDISFQLSRWALWLYRLRGGDKNKSVILSNPINFHDFAVRSKRETSLFKKKHGIPLDSFLIGRVGESFDAKWSPSLIDAFELLAEKFPKVYLCVVNTSANMQFRIDNSKHKKRIVSIDRINGDFNLSVAYSAFDVMAHISHIGESFGYVIPESVLCGTPVVSMSTPWADNTQCELIHLIQGGWVVHSQKGFLEILDKLINGKLEYKMSINAIKNFKIDYDLSSLSNRSIDYAKKYPSFTNPKQTVSFFDIIRILGSSSEKCKLIVKILLSTNSDYFRQRIIYFSDYYIEGFPFKKIASMKLLKLTRFMNNNFFIWR
jgi:glycosyltransferase involved in cell wall biosynthesis